MTFEKNNGEIQELESQLMNLEEQLKEALESGDLDKFNRLVVEDYQLQRKLSLARGEETALLLEWEFMWDTGAPCPYVLSYGGKAFLIYYIHEVDPNWDGTYVNVIDSSSDQIYPLALVEFIGCYSIKFGGANHEVFRGHPLYGKGLEWYSAHIIENSRWIQEEMKINSVHDYFEKERWKNRKHLIFVFHDELFECITESYKVEVIRDTFTNVVHEAVKRLMEY